MIKQAQELFYQGLKFDISSVKPDFCFSVPYSQVKESNIWSTSFYNKLYVKIEEMLEQHNGVRRLRLTKAAREQGFTQEYLFIALSIPEIGRYAAIRRTVVASTIPHLRVERLKDIGIPVMEQKVVDEITELVKSAFALKGERKRILKETDKILDACFPV